MNAQTSNMNLGHTARLCLQSLIIIILDLMSFWLYMLCLVIYSGVSLKTFWCPWAGWQMHFFHDAIGPQYINIKPHHSFYNVLHSQMPYSVSFFLYYLILIGSKESTEQHACRWQCERERKKEKERETVCIALDAYRTTGRQKTIITSLHLSFIMWGSYESLLVPISLFYLLNPFN